MVSYTVSFEVFVNTAVQATKFQTSTCTGSTTLRINNNTFSFNKTCFQQRNKRQNTASCIATRISQKLSTFYLVTIQFCQTIYSFCFRVKVFYLIPFFKNFVIFKSIVATQIDNFHITISQMLTNLHGVAMRQSNKNHIAFSSNIINVLHGGKILFNSSCQMRIHIGNSFASTTFGSNTCYLNFRMTFQ